MNNELQIFNNPEFGDIRMIEIDGKPYAAATDVAKMLGYSNPYAAITRHCKGVAKREGVSYTTNQHGKTTQQTLEMNFIPEGDLYRLIVNSQLPAAEKFESWIFDEVLPSIRKHGAYMTSATIEEVLLNPDTIIRLATDLKTEREEKSRLALEVAQKDQTINELKPMAAYANWILKNPGLVTITQIAKDYGMSGSRMNKLLNGLGVQYKQGNQWLLYKKYHDKGYTHSETIDIIRSDGRPDVEMYSKWTQKGRFFIYNLLKDELGVLPIIEQQASA